MEVGLDEWSVQPPAGVAPGVIRFVVKNFGSEAHELLIVQAAALTELPRAGDEIDETAIAGVPKFKIEAFASNTICEGTFELPAGSYLLLDNQPGAADRGMVGALSWADPAVPGSARAARSVRDDVGSVGGAPRRPGAGVPSPLVAGQLAGVPSHLHHVMEVVGHEQALAAEHGDIGERCRPPIHGRRARREPRSYTGYTARRRCVAAPATRGTGNPARARQSSTTAGQVPVRRPPDVVVGSARQLGAQHRAIGRVGAVAVVLRLRQPVTGAPGQAGSGRRTRCNGDGRPRGTRAPPPAGAAAPAVTAALVGRFGEQRR